MNRVRSVFVVTAVLVAAAALDVAASFPPQTGASSAAVSRGPERVRTWYYYALNDVNANVPAGVMARYADYVEDDGYSAEHAGAFKRAGGRYAAAYTDPQYVPYCRPPFSPPAGSCGGPIGDRVHDEQAWFHGRDGTRVRRYADPHFQYQEALNPASPAARRAWRETTAELLRKAPWLDLFFADDSGGPLHANGDVTLSAQFYGFNDVGTEITSDAVFRDASIGYLAAAVRPLVLNGADPITGEPPYGGAFLRAPNVLGAVHESCFRGEGGLKTDARDHWRRAADSLLANTALHKLAICFMMDRPTPENRLYALASWWLTYDPQYSVMAPIDAIPGQSALIPETGLVPANPSRTARTSVRELRSESGAYVREFSACYQDGAPIGGCAAIVNPSARETALPPLTGRYSRSLALDADDVLHGGRARWVARIPHGVAPASALVLAR